MKIANYEVIKKVTIDDDYVLQGDGDIIDKVSDGHHTFEELYDFRMIYNAGFFSMLHKTHPEYKTHKSRKHYDGEYPFNKKTMFIVSTKLPTGMISNHYNMKDWDYFKIPETPKSILKFDGHTPEDVMDRMKEYMLL